MNRFLQQLLELAGTTPFDEVLVERVRQRVTKRCSLVPVHVHKRFAAQMRIEEAAKEAIVEVFHEEFQDAWFPIRVRKDWPFANCIISGNEAVIEFSFSPETDALAGGIIIEPVKITVQRAPNILTKAARAIFDRRKTDDREPEPAPIGKPERKHEHRPVANGTANPVAPVTRADPLKSRIRPEPSRQTRKI